MIASTTAAASFHSRQLRRRCATFARGALLLASLGAWATAAGQEPRTWTAASSGKTIRATLLEQGDGFVTLRVVGSDKPSRVPIDRFSEADRSYLATLRGVAPGSAAAAVDASLYRGMMTHNGLPIANQSALRVAGFTTTNERISGPRTFWNHLLLSSEGDRVRRALEAAEKNRLRGSGLHSAFEVAANLYEGFESTAPRDRLPGTDEFAVAERARRVREEALPRWLATAPEAPVEVLLHDRIVLGSYDFENERFPIDGGHRAIPSSLQGTDLRWERAPKLPSTLPMRREEARRIASGDGTLRAHVLATVRVEEIAITDDYSSVAFCRLERIDVYLDDELTTRVHTVRYGDADPDAVAAATEGNAAIADAAAAGRAGADDLDGRMLALAKKHGLPVRLGLPWFESPGARLRRDSRIDMSTPWGRFMDLVELSRTADWLGLSAFEPAPTPHDSSTFAHEAADRLEQYGQAFVFHHFPPQKVSRYVETWLRQGVTIPNGWRGADQFGRDDLKRDFIERHRAEIERAGIDLPLRLVWSHHVELSGYDPARGAFPLGSHGPLQTLQLPVPISHKRAWMDDIPVVPFDEPCLLPMDRDAARGFVRRRSAAGGQPGGAFIAYTVRLEPVAATRETPYGRLPLIATVEAIRFYDDVDLTRLLYEHPVVSAEPCLLVRPASPDEYAPQTASPADPVLLPALIAANASEPFDRDGWETALRLLRASEEASHDEIHGYYSKRLEAARINSNLLDRGGRAREYVNTEPHPAVAEPNRPRRLLPVGMPDRNWPIERWPAAFRQRFEDHLRAYGESVRAIEINVSVSVNDGEVRPILAEDHRVADYVAATEGVQTATVFSSQLAPLEARFGVGGAPTTAAGGRRHVSLALSLSHRDLMAQLSEEQRLALARDQAATRIEMTIDLDGVDLVNEGDSGESVMLRGTPRTLSAYQIDHRIRVEWDRGERAEEKLLFTKELTSELAPEPIA
ncbi:MAG: hypothetical protein AAF805_11995, partial [Planctomycetota bacterium]